MMKLIKVGQDWFASYDGQLIKSSALVEDPLKWQSVDGLTQVQSDALAKEFPAEIEAIAGIGVKHVTPAALEDALNVAKFDTWHAVAAQTDVA